jgi:hypothetical protein
VIIRTGNHPVFRREGDDYCQRGGIGGSS